MLWPDDIVEELHRNLIEDGFDPDSIGRLVIEMAAAFPGASVTDYRSLIDFSMPEGAIAGWINGRTDPQELADEHFSFAHTLRPATWGSPTSMRSAMDPRASQSASAASQLASCATAPPPRWHPRSTDVSPVRRRLSVRTTRLPVSIGRTSCRVSA